MNSIITVFTAQLLFQFFRSLNGRHEAHGLKYKAVMLTTIIQILWLVSTTLGVKAMLELDYMTMTAYVIGGTLGVYMNFYVKVKA